MVLGDDAVDSGEINPQQGLAAAAKEDIPTNDSLELMESILQRLQPSDRHEIRDMITNRGWLSGVLLMMSGLFWWIAVGIEQCRHPSLTLGRIRLRNSRDDRPRAGIPRYSRVEYWERARTCIYVEYRRSSSRPCAVLHYRTLWVRLADRSCFYSDCDVWQPSIAGSSSDDSLLRQAVHRFHPIAMGSNPDDSHAC